MLPPSIICTPQLHLHCIESLRINTVIVLGQDNLYNKLRKKFPDPSPVKVIKLPKSGGSVKKDAACRSASVARCAQSYFGVETPGGAGRSIVTKTGMELDIIKMSTVQVGDAMLPVGQATVAESVHLRKLDMLEVNSIVGVCHPRAVEAYERTGKASHISGSAVAGFLHLRAVEEGDEDGAAKMKFTCPVLGDVPSGMVVTGEGVTWVNG